MVSADRITNTCCFLGHREIHEMGALKSQIYALIEMLVVDKKVDTFLFGSKSRFNSLCYEIVTRIKEKYPHIQRVYVRAEFPVISNDYQKYLLEHYEHSYYPESIVGAGKAVYIRRNNSMIQNCQYCVFYYEEGYVPKGGKSGTKIALDYAKKLQKTIYILPDGLSMDSPTG